MGLELLDPGLEELALLGRCAVAVGGTDEIMKDTIGEAAISGANPVLGAKGAEQSGFNIM